MSEARQRPGVASLSLREIQELRRVCNSTEKLTLALGERPAGGFDPVRLEMLRSVNDLLENLLDEQASGEITFDPTERVTLRQAIGTVETFTTTAGRQAIMRDFGMRPDRDDLQLLKQIRRKIQYPDPEDVAGTDVRYQLYTEPFRQFTAGQVGRAADGNYDVGFNESTVPPESYEIDHPCEADPNRRDSIAEAFSTLAVDMAKAVGEPRGTRQATAEDTREVVRELTFEMNDNRCYAETDRRRLKLAAKRAARSLEDTGNRRRIRVLADMADWTDYRSTVGLTDL